MNERPELDRELNGMTFRNFYYLKQELVDFAERTPCLFRAARSN